MTWDKVFVCSGLSFPSLWCGLWEWTDSDGKKPREAFVVTEEPTLLRFDYSEEGDRVGVPDLISSFLEKLFFKGSFELPSLRGRKEADKD